MQSSKWTEVDRNIIIKVAEWKGFILPEYYNAISGIKKLNNNDIHIKIHIKISPLNTKQYWLSYTGSLSQFVVTSEDILQYKRESKLKQLLNE